MNWLLSKIEKEFSGNFNFLKLLSVVYNKAKKTCFITFLYPEKNNLSEQQKNVIENFVKSVLQLNSNIVVKFKKSYLDDSLIVKALFNFFSSNFPSALAFVEKNSAKIEKDFKQIVITLKIDEEFLDYISEDEIKAEVKKELERQFCTEVFLNLEKAKIARDVVLTPKEFIKKSVPRYEVELGRNLFGGEIPPDPEFIKNISSAKQSVILAGKIENLEKKSYEAKKGKQKGKTKNYFAFTLNDTTSKIDVRYFSTISNEKQMDKLINSDEVLILGNIEEFNRKLTLYVRAISKCRLPKKLELKQNMSGAYEVVEIQPYSILEQENIFKKAIVYNKLVERGSFVVFDVETTGLNYETDELIEIGAVKIENGQIISKFSSLIKPSSPIPPSATAINNITNAMVANSPRADIVIRDFYRYTRGCALIGYNVSFDQKFIVQAAKKQGIVFDNEFIDLMPLAKSKLRLTRYKLADVVKRLEITLDGAHRAYADALATAEAFLKLNSQEYA